VEFYIQNQKEIAELAIFIALTDVQVGVAEAALAVLETK
jgi:hypothetical protein